MLIANEVIKDCRQIKEEQVIFMIDVEKVYGYTVGNLLDQVLEKKGS